MRDDFEWFDHPHTRSVKIPYVTIQRDGVISFNLAAYEALGKPAVVKLGYSQQRKIIAVKPSDPAVPKSIEMRRQKDSESFLIGGRAFTQRFGIDTSTARRYPAVLHGNELWVDLSGEFVDATGPRLGHRKITPAALDEAALAPQPMTTRAVESAAPVLQAVEEAYEKLATVGSQAEKLGLEEVFKELQQALSLLQTKLNPETAGVPADRAKSQ